MTTDATKRYPIENLRAQAETLLNAMGLDGDDARTTAEVLTDADLRGVDTHGISLLVLYARLVRTGRIRLKSEKPVVEREGPSHALIDARGGLGFAVSAQAARMAADKAAITGIAAITVRNSHHFGAAGYYARLIAEAGFVALVTTSSKFVCVVPPGASAAAVGTNPIAYAVPRRSGDPIVFDMATSTVAGNKVRMHALSDIPLPEGWVVDKQGQPVTDPQTGTSLVYEGGEGGLTPVGAHKGYGLSLLVHFLGGTLPGATFPLTGNPPRGDGDNVGHFFMAIDPAIYRDREAFFDDVDDVTDSLRKTPALDPARPVVVPGDIEAAIKAERSASGVPLAASLVEELRDLSAGLGRDFILDR